MSFTNFVQMFENSSAVIDALKAIPQSPLMGRKLRSLRPIVVNVGQFYSADRPMIISMF
ncbi:unnamed protein product, partial [Allacma fusca]